jgi:prepilin-type N-terminal cleavage/methylation domain-containing protein
MTAITSRYRLAARPQVRLRRSRRSGMGMVELLVALAISATLLTATAVAVDAAFKAYEVNQEQAVLMSKARVSLSFLTTNIRGTTLHAPDNASRKTQFAAGQTVTDTGIVMLDANNNLLRFFHDATNKQLKVVGPAGTQILAHGVESFSITMEPMRSSESIRTGGTWDLLKRASITLKVRTGGSTAPAEAVGTDTVTLSGSVMPRRNAW